MEARTQPPARNRDPAGTREAILQAAFQEMHRSGFRAAGLDAILTEAGVTKGALYHHFGSKRQLGLAVLEEIIRSMVLRRFLEPLAASDDPVETLIGVLENARREVTPEEMVSGCPLNNLAQEMSSVDEEFRERLADIFRDWRDGLANSLRRGQASNKVRGDLDVDAAATFVVATFEGSIGLAKTTRDPAVLEHCCRGLIDYFDGLRPSTDPN